MSVQYFTQSMAGLKESWKKALLDDLTKAILAAGVYLEERDLAMPFDYRQVFYRTQIEAHFDPPPPGAEKDAQSQSPLLDSYRTIEARLRELLYPKAVLRPLLNE